MILWPRMTQSLALKVTTVLHPHGGNKSVQLELLVLLVDFRIYHSALMQLLVISHLEEQL